LVTHACVVQLDLLAGKPWLDSAARLLFEILTAVQFPLKRHITLELRFRLKPRPVDPRCQPSLWCWVLSDFSFAYTCSHFPSWYKYNNRRSGLPSTVLPALTSPTRATFLGFYGDSVVTVFCSFHGIYDKRSSRFKSFSPVMSSC
jgi:hypothetical protein